MAVERGDRGPKEIDQREEKASRIKLNEGTKAWPPLGTSYYTFHQPWRKTSDSVTLVHSRRQEVTLLFGTSKLRVQKAARITTGS